MMINIIIKNIIFFHISITYRNQREFITNETPRQTATLRSIRTRGDTIFGCIFEASLRKNYINVKATDGKGLDEKAKQIRADIPKYKASQKKVRIGHPKDSDLGSENIENELLDEILGKGRRKASAPKDTNNSGSVGSNIKVSIYDERQPGTLRLETQRLPAHRFP